MPLKRFHEEEPQGGTVLHHSAGIQLPLAKQMGLEYPHVLGAEPIGSSDTWAFVKGGVQAP